MDWDDRRAALQAAFTPARPVRNQELFAGRTSQFVRVVESFSSPGEHVAIFGERGVGKTSLASIAEAAADVAGRFSIRINCTASDTPTDIWRRVGATIERRITVATNKGINLGELEPLARAAACGLAVAYPSEHDLLTSLEAISSAKPVVLTIDEFDRLGDSTVHSALVDMMKAVSDLALDITLIVVGVASTVDGLIDEHGSIGRGLNQIEMPRMQRPELVDILDRGFRQAEMTMRQSAAFTIARLSMGLPHYTHLLGLHAGLAAVAPQSDVVDVDHVELALPVALERAEQHVRELYYDATHSTQSNIYREVLLAAGLTVGDDKGYFAPGDLRHALGKILGRPVDIPHFSRHLGQFVDTRGPALEKSTAQKRPRYRFTEPLLAPYVLMRGISEH